MGSSYIIFQRHKVEVNDSLLAVWLHFGARAVESMSDAPEWARDLAQPWEKAVEQAVQAAKREIGEAIRG